MAKERLYGWNGEYPDKPLSGQALIVFNVLKGAKDEMWTGHDWTDIVGTELRTTQDPYRVVLYYILILKNKGCIRTVERDINATTKVVTDTETRRHGVTVRQIPVTDERHVVEETPAEPDPLGMVIKELEAQWAAEGALETVAAS